MNKYSIMWHIFQQCILKDKVQIKKNTFFNSLSESKISNVIRILYFSVVNIFFYYSNKFSEYFIEKYIRIHTF